MVGFPLVAEEVVGEVRFTRDAIASDSLTGRMFGAPFAARIAPPPAKVAALARLTIEGGAVVRTVARALELPLDRFMDGRTALHADVDLPRQRGEPLTVALRGDLKGVAVDLPALFGKAAAAATPGDGDTLDALVFVGEPTFPGCRITARPVGLFRMTDEKGPDEKILCVPLKDPMWSHVHDLADLNPNLLNEIEHFFQVYKDFEGHVVSSEGFGERAEALEVIASAFAAAADAAPG